MLDIFVTEPTFGRLTLVRLVAPLNMPYIVVAELVSGRLTLVRQVAPLNMFDISVTELVSQELISWLNVVLFKKAFFRLVN